MLQQKLGQKSCLRLTVSTATVILFVTLLAGLTLRSGILSAAETRTVTADESLRAWAGHRWLFGADYRELWVAPIEVEVLDLNQEVGGSNR